MGLLQFLLGIIKGVTGLLFIPRVFIRFEFIHQTA